jgi:hypothetical protein
LPISPTTGAAGIRATYVHVIMAGRFPAAEYFNAALVLITGITVVPILIHPRRRSTASRG